MGKIKLTEQFSLNRLSTLDQLVIQNVCEFCGWAGDIYYVDDENSHTICQKERIDHKSKCKSRVRMTNAQLFEVAKILVSDLAMLSRRSYWNWESAEAKAMDSEAQKAIAAYEAATGSDFWEDFNCEEEGL